MTQLNELFQLAHYAGSRFDLIQAGGGNVSLKTAEDKLFIKVSGISLSEMKTLEQCAQLETQKVIAIMQDNGITGESDKQKRENKSKEKLAAANLTPAKRPSIETFLHALLYPFTLHTHALAVNHLVICRDAKKQIATLFPNSVFVDYATPGIDLALLLKAEVDDYVVKHKQQPNIVFLKNHGLIVSANNAHEVMRLTDDVVTTIEKKLGLDYQRYRAVTDISDLYQQTYSEPATVYLSEDRHIMGAQTDLLHSMPTSPDAFVFNGYVPCVLDELKRETLEAYQAKWCVAPKVIVYQGHIYFINSTLRKARDMEEVFKFHIIALQAARGEIDVLPHEELFYLSQWEAEKYRQKQ
jgi:rhamnose utilization protein RhaD (predicted bifunctional aldolase and dehydrogenase)